MEENKVIDIESIELDLDPDVEVDESTRRTLKIVKAIELLTPALPPEGVVPVLRPVAFNQEFARDGWDVVFFGGTAVAIGKIDTMLVPERTRKILEVLQIPFRVLSKEELNVWPDAIEK